MKIKQNLLSAGANNSFLFKDKWNSNTINITGKRTQIMLLCVLIASYEFIVLHNFLIISVIKPPYRSSKSSWRKKPRCLTFLSKNNFQQPPDISHLALSLLEREKSVGKTWKSQISPNPIPSLRLQIAGKVSGFSWPFSVQAMRKWRERKLKSIITKLNNFSSF